jgi:hypothetical protein
MAWARIAYETAAASLGDHTQVQTTGVDTSGASLGVAVVGTYSGSGGDVPGASDVSDANGNTWTKRTNVDSGNSAVALYYTAAPIVGASHWVKFNRGANCYPSILVLWVSGVDTASPYHSESAGASSPSTSGLQPGGAGVAGLLAVTGEISNKVGALSPNVTGSGFTLEAEVAGGAAQNVQADLAWKVATAVENPLWGWSGNQDAAVAMAIFNALVVAGNFLLVAN